MHLNEPYTQGSGQPLSTDVAMAFRTIDIQESYLKARGNRCKSYHIQPSEREIIAKRRYLDLEDGSPPKHNLLDNAVGASSYGYLCIPPAPENPLSGRKASGRPSFSKPFTRRIQRTSCPSPYDIKLHVVTPSRRNSVSSMAVSSDDGTDGLGPLPASAIVRAGSPNPAMLQNGIVLGEQFGEKNPYLSQNPMYLGQENIHQLSSNWAVKAIPFAPAKDGPLTRDKYGKLRPLSEKEIIARAKAEAFAANTSGTVFAPLVDEKPDKLFLVMPLAKASLTDVWKQLHSSAYTDALRKATPEVNEKKFAVAANNGRYWAALRMVGDMLEQLGNLHDAGLAHNNLTENTVLMHGDLHFHLGGFGHAKKFSEVPAGGDWTNKRLESVFASESDHRKDDLWALGKLMLHLMFGRKELAAENSKSPFYIDPFRPAYQLPDAARPDGLALPGEIKRIRASVDEARALHELWSKMHASFANWFAKKKEAQRDSKLVCPDFPDVHQWRKREATKHHAERIHQVFYNLSRMEPHAMELALKLFHPDPTKVDAKKLAGYFNPIFVMVRMTPEERQALPAGELARPFKDLSLAYRKSLPQDETRRSKMEKKLERMRAIYVALSSVDGAGMRLCMASSTEGGIPPLKKRVRGI